MLANAWAMATYGPRATYVFGMATFIIGSLLGAVSATLEMLIVARARVGTTVRARHEWNLFDSQVLGWHLNAEQDDTFFAQLFDAMPIAAVLDGRVFVMHGGLGSLSKNMTVAQINKEDRFQKSNLLHELLWNGEFRFCLFMTCHAEFLMGSVSDQF